MLKTVVLLHIFYAKRDIFIFQDSLINRKNSVYLKNKSINVFIATFDQFNALLNKSIN